MTEWSPDIAEGYDRVASAYAEKFGDELDRKPFDRQLLDAFAAATRGRGPVADIGCGPGHVGQYLSGVGCDVVGIDIAPNMARVGRSINTDVRFVVGDFFRLPFITQSLVGAIAFYSLIHAPRAEATDALRELKRVLRRGAPLLAAVHGGSGEAHADEFLGEQVSIDATFFEPDEIAGYLRDAGFEVEGVQARTPYDSEGSTTRIYVRARRPA